MAAPIGNKYAIGNSGGRPPMYESVDKLIEQIDSYFEYIKGESHKESFPTTDKDGEQNKSTETDVWDRYPEPATVTGLALYLGFCDKNALYDYQAKEEFSHCIKNARTRIEHEYEKRLYIDKPTGAIFALKNMGWVDASNVNHGGQQGNPIQTKGEHRFIIEDMRDGSEESL